ncbi:MAG: ectonucleotide pyrophosphatase/phosphodiesterase [Lachnospiraceae bacterium]|nr:ectonucleotide pyrophosphatase/phosphodiesterase [Lachnospiraceae bacterium]
MKNRLIVISFDAVGARDLPFLKTLKNFKEFFETSSYCENVSSVYPSVTYPAHTSIVTGRYPSHHGVVNNTLVQPGRICSPDWMWQRKYVKGTTLYDEAIKNNMTVASLFWPVTAKSKITYNMPEVLANRPWQNQIVVSLKNGTPLYEFKLLKKFGKQVDGVHQPQLDNFNHQSALYTLEKYHPDLMLIHYTDVDTKRHENGLDHEEVTNALLRHDKRLGEIQEKLKDLGIYEETTIAILGDHYQMDVKQIVYFNYLFLTKGWINVKNGKIRDYQVLCHNADGSCYIYVKNRKIQGDVEKLLKQCEENPIYGIERVYTGQEAGKMGADSACDFMIEAKEGFYYLDEFETLTEPVKDAKKHVMWATHGYHPDKKDYQTFFAIKGPSIKQGIKIEKMSLVDEGPTLAKVISVNLLKTDGKCMDMIFK